MDLKAETAVAMLRKAASLLEEMDLPPDEVERIVVYIQCAASRLRDQTDVDEYVTDKIHEKLDELY